MKAFKRIKTVLFTCFATLAIAFGGLAFGGLTVQDQALAATGGKIDSDVYQTDGASVRVFTKDEEGNLVALPKKAEVQKDQKGIRFHVEMGVGYEYNGTQLLTETGKVDEETGEPVINEETGEQETYYKLADGFKTYTLVLPTRLLEGDLTLETSKVMKLNTSEYWDLDKYGNLESVGYVWNIPQKWYTDNFSFRGVICTVAADGTETAVASTEISERSVATVAKKAYTETIDKNTVYWGSETLDNTAAPLIKEFVPTYNITYIVGNETTTEEVLWGDAPQSVPTENVKETWYCTENKEEIDVSQVMEYSESCNFVLETTTSETFVLTGVAAHENYDGMSGVKIYATLHNDQFDYHQELDIHAVNVEHIRNEEVLRDGIELQSVWTMEDGGQMRLFFELDSSQMESGDKIIIKGDSIFYADGVMYKLTEDYTLDYDGVDYGMFLGNLYNKDVSAIYNAPEDLNEDGVLTEGEDEFTIRVEFYEDVLINDSFTFKNDNLPDGYKYPVYIQCGVDDDVTHEITGGIYYWNNGNDKILELIADDNMAYGWHGGDKLYAAPGTMCIQNGGYYVFEEAMYAEFVESDQPEYERTGGYWTVGTEVGAYGSDEFEKFGEYVSAENEIRFDTNNVWFSGLTGAKELLVENTNVNEAYGVYYTTYDGKVSEISELIYHGYGEYKILGIPGGADAKAGDTVTIVGGTRLWAGTQEYCTFGDLNGEERTVDIVFCYNGQIWFSHYDTANNVNLTSSNVTWVSSGDNGGEEVRLWTGVTFETTTPPQGTAIFGSSPILYNGVQRTSGYYYGSANMISFYTGVATANEGDYFVVPAGATWWTTFYGDSDSINRCVTVTEELKYTYVNGNWVAGDQHAEMDITASNATVFGNPNGVINSNYTFTVTPNDGYVVSAVTINGVSQEINENNTYTFTAQANNTVVVETVIGYSVTFNVASGISVDNGIEDGTIKTVAKGGSLTFTVTANEGYKLAQVTGATGSNGTYTVTPASDMDVTITAEKLYKVTYANTEAYTVTADVASGAWVENGTQVTFNVSANSGYVLTAVSGATKVSDGQYVATVSGADVSVSATTVAASSLTIADSLLGIENRTNWNASANPESYYFAITYTGGTNKWLNTAAGYTGYWNDNGATLAAKNNGVDIMEYLYLNDTSARELVTKNANGETTYKGTATFPLSKGGIFAPISVETTTGSGLIIRILKEYATSFTITIKAGFTLLDENSNRLYVSEDIVYQYANGTFTKVENSSGDQETERIVLLDASTQTLSKWDYGAEFAITSGTDAEYGAIWNITISDIGEEQSFQNPAIDTTGYTKVYFYVYNPLAKEERLAIHGGWTAWNAATVMLAAQGWTKVELDVSVFTTDDAGKIFLVLQEVDRGSLAGEWKISSFYGA